MPPYSLQCSHFFLIWLVYLLHCGALPFSFIKITSLHLVVVKAFLSFLIFLIISAPNITEKLPKVITFRDTFPLISAYHEYLFSPDTFTLSIEVQGK